MAAFQWVNPKGWLVGMVAIAFPDRRADDALAQDAIFATVFTLVALPSCLPWLALGAPAFPSGTTRPARPQRCHGTLLAASTVLLVNPPLTARQDPSPPARDRATPPLPGVATLAGYQFWTRLRRAGGAPETDADGSRAAAAPHAVTHVAGWAVSGQFLVAAGGRATYRLRRGAASIGTSARTLRRQVAGPKARLVTQLRSCHRMSYVPVTRRTCLTGGGVLPGVPERTPGAAGSPRAWSGSVGSPAGAAGRPRSRTSGREG